MNDPDDVLAGPGDQAEAREALIRGLIASVADLQAENVRLRRGVEDYRAGNYLNPRRYRPNPCPHGLRHWEECDACNDAALAAILDPTPSPDPGAPHPSKPTAGE